MSQRHEIIIVGAGAIGRGYLPWVFADHYDLVFVDQNEKLVKYFRRKKKYTTCRVKDGALKKHTFSVKAAYRPSEFMVSRHLGALAVFINVGPRNCRAACWSVKDLPCPIIISENDADLVNSIRNGLKREDVYFAIPDVITSSSAPKKILKEHPYAVVTETGVLHIDSRVGNLEGDFVPNTSKELAKQWSAKLFLHNTPHCIAAYLGANAGFKYIHEVMQHPALRATVCAAMEEMLRALKSGSSISHQFLDWYAAKELGRFACELLHDPISRVAREPLRKLEADGRLVGAAQLCLSHGVIPENVMVGIISAILFKGEEDPDRHVSFLAKALPREVLFTHILGLRKGEVLEILLSKRFEGILAKLRELAGPNRGVVDEISTLAA